jgi:hypothetical protein
MFLNVVSRTNLQRLQAMNPGPQARRPSCRSSLFIISFSFCVPSGRSPGSIDLRHGGLGLRSNVQPTQGSLNDRLKIPDISLVRCQVLHFVTHLGVARNLFVPIMAAVIFLDHERCPIIYTESSPTFSQA